MTANALFNDLIGKTLKEIKEDGNAENLIFIFEDGDKYEMSHNQDCCESVSIESIVGDLNDLIGSPLLLAEEAVSDASDASSEGSGTWTFYKFATINGYVDIRWLGTSNGYYSESVNMFKINE